MLGLKYRTLSEEQLLQITTLVGHLPFFFFFVLGVRCVRQIEENFLFYPGQYKTLVQCQIFVRKLDDEKLSCQVLLG